MVNWKCFEFTSLYHLHLVWLLFWDSMLYDKLIDFDKRFCERSSVVVLAYLVWLVFQDLL